MERRSSSSKFVFVCNESMGKSNAKMNELMPWRHIFKIIEEVFEASILLSNVIYSVIKMQIAVAAKNTHKQSAMETFKTHFEDESNSLH